MLDRQCSRFGEIIPSAVFTGSEQLTMAARFSGLVGRFLATYSNLFNEINEINEVLILLMVLLLQILGTLGTALQFVHSQGAFMFVLTPVSWPIAKLCLVCTWPGSCT